MKRIAALVVTSLLALSACSGGGTTAPRIAGALAPNSSKFVLSAYRVPLVHSASIDAAAALGAASRRLRSPSTIGSLPTIDTTIIDAPRFGYNAQINVAIVGAEAVGADGVAYPIVSYPTPQVVNILNFKTSALWLGSSGVPAQVYSSLRILVQASASTLVAAGVTYPVTFGFYDGTHTFTPAPSDISAIDFPMTIDTTTGNATVMAHFNALEQVKIKNGVATIGSKHAAAPYNNSSVIDGTVVNNAGLPVELATVAVVDSLGNVIATTSSAADGTFELHAIIGGGYQIMVYNSYIPGHGEEIDAIGADGAAAVSGPSFSVPGGYKIVIGNIVD